VASSGRGAFFVAAGIFLSRIMGLVRERIFAHFLGNSVPAAAFKAAWRIPGLLQNLFGEGVLSSSFIPAYASLLGKNDDAEADRVASAIFGLLALAVTIVVAIGVVASPLLVRVIAPGFEGEARELTIALVRIMFPGAGMLVLCAWCLGILNSHRKFFLSYAAPVAWNIAIITTLLVFGGGVELAKLAEIVAWGTVAGCALQFFVQLPPVLSLLGRFRPTLERNATVTTVLRGAAPTVVARGVVQLSGWIDEAFSTIISTRALATIAYAQILYLLPVSLFGMSISAAELPEMSREQVGTDEEVKKKLIARIDTGLRRIAFFVIPSSIALFTFGDILGGALFQTGKFGARDTRYMWYVLMGASVGLYATTRGRLYQSAFYALKDTRSPLRFALARLATATAIGAVFGLWAPEAIGLPRDLGAVGLGLASATSASVEVFLLRRGLERRIGRTGVPAKTMVILIGSALAAASAAIAVKLVLVRMFGTDATALEEWGGAWLPAPAVPPIFAAALAIAAFGAVYGAATLAFGIGEARAIVRRVLRR
jgi:putative peptidoglycan lipid II flippase